MDIKTLEQALKLQGDFAARLTQTLVSGGAGKLPGIEVLVKQKEQSLTLARNEVDAAIKERDLAVSRWDERVALCKANADKLQVELDDLKKQISGKDRPERPVVVTGNIRGKKDVAAKKKVVVKKAAGGAKAK